MAEDHDRQSGKEQPIIIKKKRKGGGHGHHGGAWKVAYADFVTAMMAFFIVMWILASSEDVKEQVASYFKDPGAFNFITGERTVPIDLGIDFVRETGRGNEGDESGDESFIISFDNEMRDSVVERLKEKAIQDSVWAAQKVAKIGDALKEMFKERMRQEPELENILSSIKIEMTKEGLRIELIESTESLFFEIGSSNLKPEARNILIRLASEIGKLSNYVEVEGHTDSRSFGSGSGYTNWELSADRANSARRILEKNGMWEGQIKKVTGYSDNKLRNPDNPFDISNRRISILIKQLTANQFLETVNTE